MSLQAPVAGWYGKKIATDEKWWIVLATIVCLVTFVWMIVWHVYGNQNPSNTSYKTTPSEFFGLVTAFNTKNKVGEENGIPIVMPQPGSEVFFAGQMWRWSSIPVLKKGEWYTFHLSSLDVLHGFSVQPINMNFMVIPGYDYVLKFKPTETGEYKIICNEFCGIAHHTMIGKMIVYENKSDLQKYGIE
jgi:cytochrome c oxidase subunit 2